MAEPGITLGLKFQSRVLCPQVAQKDRSQWLVATNCLREENEVRFVEYDPGTESVRSPSAYVHRAEVWDLAACPSRTDRFFTVNNDGRRARRADFRSRALLRGMKRRQHVQLALLIHVVAPAPT
eukprot:evm.model.scf_4026.1 EVM.evm.TU.scf_4026.1   scf_4026:837-1294(+)